MERQGAQTRPLLRSLEGHLPSKFLEVGAGSSPEMTQRWTPHSIPSNPLTAALTMGSPPSQSCLLDPETSRFGRDCVPSTATVQQLISEYQKG